MNFTQPQSSDSSPFSRPGEGENLYRVFFENTNEAVMVVDSKGKFLQVNPSACRHLRYTHQELAQMFLKDIEAPQYHRLLQDRAHSILNSGHQVYQTAHIRKDGGLVRVEISAFPIRFGDDPAILSIVKPLPGETEPLTPPSHLHGKHYRLLFEKMLDAFLLMQMVGNEHGEVVDGCILAMNPAFEKLFNIKARDTIGNLALDLFHNIDPRWYDAIRLLWSTGEPSHFQVYSTNIDRHLEVTLFSPQKGEAAVIFEDITERINAQRKIQSQFQRMAALRSIDAVITTSLNLRLILSVLLDQVVAQLEVDAADFLMLNTASHELEYSAGKGFRSADPAREHVHILSGTAGLVVREKKTQFIPDLKKCLDFARASALEEDEFISYCGTPLIAKGEVKGVMEIFNRSHMRFDQDWMDFFETLAGQAAIAIENAGLFEGLQRSTIELTEAYEATINGWSKALDLRDEETEGHTRRVTEASVRLARRMGVVEEEVVHIQRGALLHDIGKMGVPDRILLKPGPLTVEEWEIMRRHPVYAYDLLSPIPFLRPALDIPYCHHERWDGRGYPRGLAGEEIPLSARIFAVIDVWDALRSDRPYRESWPDEQVLEYLEDQAGRQFDPEVVEHFLKMQKEGELDVCCGDAAPQES